MNDFEKKLIIDALTQNDIEDIKQALSNGDESLLKNVIQGNNFIPLNKLSDNYLFEEFKNRFKDSFLENNIPSYISPVLFKYLKED
jgi:hypothetical protein